MLASMVRRSLSTRGWRVVLTLLLAPVGLASQQPPLVDPALQARHDAFFAAIRAHDVAAFTDFFSRTSPWRHRIRFVSHDFVSPDSDEVVLNTVTFAQLQRSLQQRDDDYYGAFFKPGTGHCGTVRQAAVSESTWTAVQPGKFVLGDEPIADSSIYIVWRQEQGRWVIDEIAEIVHVQPG